MILIKKSLTSSNWSDGQIIVEAADTAKVQIVLNGADITSQTGSVLQIKTADKVFLTLADGTVNQMTDAESYADTSETAADAAIYSKTDLTINGGGALTVNGRYKDGIKSKDELTITGGQLTVSAQDDALTGKDSVAILDGSFVITAGGDGIKSSNTSDTTKGWVSIDGGSFKITAGGDGIQAETIVEINDGTFEIVSGGGSTSAAASQPGQMTPPNRPNQGQQNGHRPPHGQGPQGQQGFNGQWQQSDTNTAAGESNTQSTSSKGVKAGTDLLINGGTMTVNTADDTLHSNGSITIQAGSLTLTSGDDGIHAETDLNITGSAVIDITNSVEGLEAKVVNISGGTVNVNASDDGINATGGTSSDGGFGGGMDQVQEGVAVNISGGVITVNAQGDGLDSNGNVTVSGGTTVIYGPTNNGNGSLDYNGTADISGGTFIAAGSSGMYQGFSQNSSQSSVAFYHNGSAGEQLTLADSAGNVIASFPGVKNYQVVLISTGRLKTGTSYTVYTGGTLSETGSGAVTGGTIKNGTAVMTVTAE
ncbi:dockerin type 1 [Lachnospiraceae bacterium oral taxon 500]|nr:dockerin type 1 [Lachnospiraceae bacterium oral taxon 500]